MRARENQRRGAARLARLISQLLRAACLTVPLTAAPGGAVLAQEAEPERLSADIPSGPLAQALAALAEQTGLQIVYVSSVVSNLKSGAVPAGSTAQQALTLLLRGTGLKFEFLTPRSVRILTAPVQPTRYVADGNESVQDEIIVTANRREEVLQNVPMTIQVLTGATLSELNVSTFDDLVPYLPGVTAHGIGPAQNTLYIRGLGTTEPGIQVAGTVGIFPNVAVYLDEQSAQLPGRNLDIYAADMERIEVLEGPQGTLFGAGAEAGAIRYITNKPKLGVTEGSVEARYSVTAHGDPGSALSAVFNIPLLDDRLAVRAVIFDDRRGGYLDNVPGIFQRLPTDASIADAGYAPDGVPGVPPNSVVLNNFALAGSAINPVTYQGLRAQALYQVNDSWSVLLAQSYQSMQADGVFSEAVTDSTGVPLPPLSTQLFNASYDKDRFENTALTVNGQVGGVELVYAGAYSVRNIDQVQDYTNYARSGGYADYYQCANPGPTSATAQCFTPSSTWHDRERNTHQSHELRIGTPAQRRVRGVAGLFYETYRIGDQDDWFYGTALPYFALLAPPDGYWLLDGKPVPGSTAYGTDAVFVHAPVTLNNPNVRPPGDVFFNDTTRGTQQRATFASVDFDLLPRVLTLTAGTRYYRSTATEAGASVAAIGCSTLTGTRTPCIDLDSDDLDAYGLNRTYSGFRSRASLSWKVREATMLYATWSQGFRAGGFNRGIPPAHDSPFYGGSAPFQAQARANGGYSFPLAYAPDTLINTEAGWRTGWLDGRLQWNGTLYQEDWKHAQVGAGAVFGYAGVVVNGGNYRVRGLESSARLHLLQGLTLDAAGSWNHGRLVQEGAFYWANGQPIDFASLNTANGMPVANLAGALGSPLAGAPAFQGNLRARYQVDFDGLHGFTQLGVTHQSHSLASTTNASIDAQNKGGVYELAPFTTVQGSVGAERDNWSVQVVGENLTDTRAQLFATYLSFVKTVTVNRPRTVGLRLDYRFGG